MITTIAPLKVPWHPDKGTDTFASSLVFIGLLWNLSLVSYGILNNVTSPYLSRNVLSSCTMSIPSLPNMLGPIVPCVMSKNSMAPFATSPLSTLMVALVCLRS